jgi:hypothetical protein
MKQAAAAGHVPDEAFHAFLSELFGFSQTFTLSQLMALPTGERLCLSPDRRQIEGAIRMCEDLHHAVSDGNGELARNAIRRLVIFCDTAGEADAQASQRQIVLDDCD